MRWKRLLKCSSPWRTWPSKKARRSCRPTSTSGLPVPCPHRIPAGQVLPGGPEHERHLRPGSGQKERQLEARRNPAPRRRPDRFGKRGRRRRPGFDSVLDQYVAAARKQQKVILRLGGRLAQDQEVKKVTLRLCSGQKRTERDLKRYVIFAICAPTSENSALE